MAKLIGQDGNITVGAATVPVSEWSITVSNDTQEVTDTGSAGWASNIAGINSAELSFKAFWGGAAALLSTTFAIGTKVTADLAIGSSGTGFSGDFYIASFTVTNNAKAPVEFQCTGKSDGEITMPS